MRLYYNPHCSKSRAALELLREAGHTPEVVDYLETPPDTATLEALIAAIDEPAAAIVRVDDALFAQLGEHVEQLDRERVLVLLSAQPQLLQRPILVVGERAVIARPPERVFELVDSRQDTDS